MRSALWIPLLLGSLGGCVLVFDDEVNPVDPGEAPVPDPDPGPGETPDSPTLAQQAKALLAEWSGCMSLASFTAAGMAPAWSQLSSAQGKCTACHVEASVSFPISSDAAAFFQVVSEHSLAMLQFFTVDLTSLPGKVIIDARSFQVVGSGTPPYEPHPRFTVEGAPATALARFHDATAARKAAGVCDPPRLID